MLIVNSTLVIVQYSEPCRNKPVIYKIRLNESVTVFSLDGLFKKKLDCIFESLKKLDHLKTHEKSNTMWVIQHL